MSDEQSPRHPDPPLEDGIGEPDVAERSESEPPVQYGVGPFSIREVALVGIWVLAFLFSFFSLRAVDFASVWTSGLLWVLTIGVPTVAVFLIVLRRLSPQGIRRVGSLGIDQFASVAFSVAAMVWLQMVWDIIAFGAETGLWVHSWVPWAELVLMLAGVALTVFGPLLPVMRDDFIGRTEIPAHRNARPLRAVAPRPLRERPRPAAHDAPAPDAAAVPAAVPATGATHPEGAPYAGAPYADGTSYGEGAPYAQSDPFAEGAPQSSEATEASDTSDTSAYDTGGFSAFVDQLQGDQSEPATEVLSTPAPNDPMQPFWALSPVDRDVLDDSGAPLFTVGPTAWALVIEDRGEVFVIRHEDGRIGYLHDVTGVTRG
ncbi:hypothetical protein [Microbacterium caowuchunii]|uniref:hypothetical protein n=1 Tax=Microbacterium caowuchunii TaxID=2614638 RepID=UPI001EE9A286|nr:hypothetical protein [Microbacterium caowuchunii]